VTDDLRERLIWTQDAALGVLKHFDDIYPPDVLRILEGETIKNRSVLRRLEKDDD